MSETTDLFDAMYTARSIRRYRPDPIPAEIIAKLLEAATRAPNGTNLQTWRFLVIRDPDLRRQIGEIYQKAFYEVFPPERLAELNDDPDRQRVMRSAVYLAETMATEPPVLLIGCLATGLGSASAAGRPAAQIWSRGSSIYPAIQNLLLAARAYGIGGCLTTIHLRYEEQVKAALSIPAEYDTYALVPLGYARDNFGPLRRQPVTAVTFADRWGEPFLPRPDVSQPAPP